MVLLEDLKDQWQVVESGAFVNVFDHVWPQVNHLVYVLLANVLDIVVQLLVQAQERRRELTPVNDHRVLGSRESICVQPFC